MRYLFFGVLLLAPLCAQDRGDRLDLTVVSRIKTEAFDNSRVMDTLGYLTDVYGPRLTASPEFREAADWVVKRLQSYGVENVRLEKWGPFGRSWSLKQYALEMIEPRYALLDSALPSLPHAMRYHVPRRTIPHAATGDSDAYQRRPTSNATP